jgi:hypothetical protein
MAASLVYHWRRGVLTIAAGGETLSVATHSTSQSIQAWEKVQEHRAGKVTLWDHCFELPGAPVVGPVIHRIGIEPSAGGKLEIYDYPGEYLGRFDSTGKGEKPSSHPHVGAAIFVGGRRGGTYVHGWPPCSHKMCVVVLQQWDRVFRAVAAEAELRFSIESP